MFYKKATIFELFLQNPTQYSTHQLQQEDCIHVYKLHLQHDNNFITMAPNARISNFLQKINFHLYLTIPPQQVISSNIRAAKKFVTSLVRTTKAPQLHWSCELLQRTSRLKLSPLTYAPQIPRP